MKRITLFAAIAISALLFVSCGKDNYKTFIGTWGLEKIEYYNIDHAGYPIAASMNTYYFVPGDTQSGIDLIFREDKTGEMRDRSQDTIYVKDTNVDPPVVVDTIICPDTTLVTTFTYSFDEKSSILFMTIKEDGHTTYIYEMNIVNLESNSFVYENEYRPYYIERAYMKRLSSTPSKSASRNNQLSRPNKKGSFLSGK